MLAARCHTYGPPDNLRFEELDDPRPGPGEVRVRVHAASVNYPDVLVLADRYQVSCPLPFTAGSEFAGVVDEVGVGVDSPRVGDAVAGAVFVGAFAEQVVVPAAGLSPLPVGMTFADGAAYGVTYRTAYLALRSVAGLAAGEWVVVLGAAGGIGTAAIDIAHALGGRVLAAASSEEKLELCRSMGAEATVNYRAGPWKDRVRELTGGGSHVVIDPVGGDVAEPALRSLRWGGRFVTVGFASGEIPRLPLNLVLLKGISVMGLDIRTFAGHAPDTARRHLAELEALIVGGLRPRVTAVHPFDQLATVLSGVAERGALGKIVIDVSGEGGRVG